MDDIKVSVGEIGANGFSPLSVEVDYRDRICYALSYNRIPFINSVTVTNGLGGVAPQITVRVEMEWTASERQPMKPQGFILDTPAVGESVEVAGDGFRLEDAALVDLEETTNARLLVTVEDGAGVSQREERDVVVLARNQWVSRDDLLSSLAAFVQPNHPTVNEILADASRILQSEGKPGSLEGYQSGPERASDIGRVVYMALQRRIDRYVEIPAGFDDEGQKVRPLDDVLEHRQGTCIDLACAYASCLEQAGLHPLVCLVHGHAFAGFFVNEVGDQFPAVIRNFATIISLIESGEVVLAETVGLTREDEFAVARAEIVPHLREVLIGNCERCDIAVKAGIADTRPHLRALVNVLKCHKEGVLPLPARVVRDGIVTIVIDNGPSEPPVLERRDEKTGNLLPNSVPARVQQWKNALLDLTFRNRLLNHKPGNTGIMLFTPPGGLGAVEDRLSQGQTVLVRPSDDLTEFMRERGFTNLEDEVRQRGFRAVQEMLAEDLTNFWRQSATLWGASATDSFVSRMKKLLASAKDEEQQTGVNNLYMTFGTLRWNDPKSSAGPVTSPVFMTPIRVVMRRGSPVPVITVDDSAMTSINYCLIEALRSRRGLKLEWFAKDMADVHGLDIERGLQELRKEILSERLTDQGFEVLDDASIDLLRFNKIRLWKDLNDHWELFMRNPVVRHLIENGRGSLFTDPNDPEGLGITPVDDAELMNPQPADGAQSRAIKRALSDHTFVLEGPPGTGKSQTITNLLANALARGKKVLFVAEKPAALEVVKERLQEVGLDPFCLDMHDKGSTPEDLKKQLRDALAFVPNADMTRWDELDMKFRLVAQVLCAYRDRLHGPGRNGRSFYDAYSRLLELGDGPVASVSRALYEAPGIDVDRWRAVLAGIEDFAQVARPRPGHPWMFTGHVDVDGQTRVALETLVTRLSHHVGTVNSVEDEWSALVRAVPSSRDLEGLVSMMDLCFLRVRPSAGGWRVVAAPGWAEGVEKQMDAIDAEIESCSDVVSAVGPGFLDVDLSVLVSAVREAAGSFVLGRRGRVRRALAEYGNSPVFSKMDPDEVVSTVVRMRTASDTVRGLTSSVRDDAGWLLGHDWSAFRDGGVEQARRRLEMVGPAALFVGGFSGLSSRAVELLDSQTQPGHGLRDAAAGIMEGFEGMAGLLGATPESVGLWAGGRPFMDVLSGSLPDWMADADSAVFRSLTRWRAFADQVALLDSNSLEEFRRELLEGAIPAGVALDAFDRGLMAVTVTVVGQENDLDVFDHAVHNRKVGEFIGLLKDRELMLRRVIPFLLHASRDFDSAATTGEVGELKTELVARKRGARSIRNLLAKFPDLIPALAPCFLMSPDSIAKFLEPGRLEFDLIVFDEASQIPVSFAAGALGRAAAAVVVGDSKQMPPTAVAVVAPVRDESAAAAAADDASAPEDEESILDECVGIGVQREWLEWHYRSRDEILIKFSNDKYYDGRLSSFPAPFLEVPGCGIEYHRVQGVFDSSRSRTNAVEADAIVAEVKRRANDPVLRRQSLGIVTMNLEQRELIMKKLGQLDDPAVTALLESEDDQESLFVLNLESVQGRERDVIILGTSFSRPAGGEKMNLNFGPITKAGGERRLNVAITRARRLMVIFSSFDPTDMSHAASLGLQHLRDYLAMAKEVGEGRRPASNVPGDASDDLHRSLVVDALRERGMIVEQGVGLSSFKVDLAVTLPGFEGRWLVGVLLDGKVWASRPLALDRDALPSTVLEKAMGWQSIVRVWLPSWRLDAAEIVNDIHDAVVRASREPVVSTPVVPVSTVESETLLEEESPTGDLEPAVPVAAALPNQRPFVVPSPPGLMGSVADLEPPSDGARRVFDGIVEEFGPMSVETAIKLTATGFGLSRVRDARLQELRVLADPARCTFTDFGVHIYPRGLINNSLVSPAFTWFRLSTFAERVVQDIPPHELGNLFRDLARAGRSIDRAELSVVALSRLGYARKTPDAVNYVVGVIDWAVSVGLLAERDGRVSAAD